MTTRADDVLQKRAKVALVEGIMLISATEGGGAGRMLFSLEELEADGTAYLLAEDGSTRLERLPSGLCLVDGRLYRQRGQDLAAVAPAERDACRACAAPLKNRFKRKQCDVCAYFFCSACCSTDIRKSVPPIPSHLGVAVSSPKICSSCAAAIVKEVDEEAAAETTEEESQQREARWHDESLPVLAAGRPLLKYGRGRGPPHIRFFVYSPDRQVLAWAPNKPDMINQADQYDGIPLTETTLLTFGITTDVMRKHQSKVKNPQFVFSLINEDRTLDVECATEQEFIELSKALGETVWRIKYLAELHREKAVEQNVQQQQIAARILARRRTSSRK